MRIDVKGEASGFEEVLHGRVSVSGNDFDVSPTPQAVRFAADSSSLAFNVVLKKAGSRRLTAVLNMTKDPSNVGKCEVTVRGVRFHLGRFTPPNGLCVMIAYTGQACFGIGGVIGAVGVLKQYHWFGF